MITPEASFHVRIKRSPDRLLIRLSGVIDEFADLDQMGALTGPEVRLHLKDIRRVNSFGVRAWIELVATIPPETALIFEHCSPPIIDQCNMVAGFLGHGSIESFYAPMVCDDCDEHLYRFFNTDVCRALGCRLPAMPCPNCRGIMEVDDLEEQYLHFLHAD